MSMIEETAVLGVSMMAQGSLSDFGEMGRNFGPVGWAVIGILLLMSIWSFGVMLDRGLMYAAARKHSRLFVRQVAGALREGKLDEAMLIAERNKKSHIAKVTATGLAEFQQASPRMSQEKVIESARRSLDRSVAIVHAEFERGLASLATIGSTAPFVGLFGTVVGILTAFGKIAEKKEAGFTIVAGGISEALVATALGLLVAIPAVWAFNSFSNRLKAFSVEMDSSSAELVNYFVARLEERQ
ncbi:MAG: MotA/TolQ/ExbB proton channel family protein [Candidatus Acidiferrales bacterium]